MRDVVHSAARHCSSWRAVCPRGYLVALLAATMLPYTALAAPYSAASPATSPAISEASSTVNSPAHCYPWPLVIAHRGASGYRPEHSQMAYELALQQGADVLELDLVVSLDGQLIIRHENELSLSTNIADIAAFQARKTRKQIDGLWVEGWFAEDFSWAELQTLKLRESKPAQRPDNTRFNDQAPLWRLQDFLQWLKTPAIQAHVFDIYIELKHPYYFSQLKTAAAPQGYDMAALLAAQLDATALRLPHAAMHSGDPMYSGDPMLSGDQGAAPSAQRSPADKAYRHIYLQAFEPTVLQQWQQQHAAKVAYDVTVVQLLGDITAASRLPKDNFSHPYDWVGQAQAQQPLPALAFADAKLPDYAAMVTPAGLTYMKSYADALGPWYPQVSNADNGQLQPWVQQAKAHGFKIHPYTLRQGQDFLRKNSKGQIVTMQQELQWLFQQGIDGVFTDEPDVAIATRQAMRQTTHQSTHQTTYQTWCQDR